MRARLCFYVPKREQSHQNHNWNIDDPKSPWTAGADVRGEVGLQRAAAELSCAALVQRWLPVEIHSV